MAATDKTIAEKFSLVVHPGTPQQRALYVRFHPQASDVKNARAKYGENVTLGWLSSATKKVEVVA